MEGWRHCTYTEGAHMRCACGGATGIDSTAAHDGLNVAWFFTGHVTDLMIAGLVRDLANFDFRPVAPSSLVDGGGGGRGEAFPVPAVVQQYALTARGAGPDIGAYEAGDTVYWIPGRVEGHASSPVPPDAATHVRPDADLMFLGAKGAAAHTGRLFLGAGGGEGGKGTAVALKAATLSGGENVLTPASPLTPGANYTWKVDATLVDGAVVEGMRWTFAVGCADVGCTDCGTDAGPASCVTCAAGLTNVAGTCTTPGGCMYGSWAVEATPSKYGAPKTKTVAGSFANTFSIKTVASAFCAKHGLDSLAVADQAGTAVLTLSCSNQGFTLATAWSCSQCAPGFARDASEASGCKLT